MGHFSDKEENFSSDVYLSFARFLHPLYSAINAAVLSGRADGGYLYLNESQEQEILARPEPIILAKKRARD